MHAVTCYTFRMIHGFGVSAMKRREFISLLGGAGSRLVKHGSWSVLVSTQTRPVIRLLFTILVGAVISSQATTAQNKVSQTLLELSEDERNETFTRLLQDNHAKCDRVIRTLFSGATVDLDDWEVLCRDRNAYSVSIPPELRAGIDFLNCRELLATNKMLLEKAGSKIKASGCKIKSVERLRSSRRLIR
jgi:hypothetical protein